MPDRGSDAMSCTRLAVCLIVSILMIINAHAQIKDHSTIERELLPVPVQPSGRIVLRGAGPRSPSAPAPPAQPVAGGASDLTVQFVSGSAELTPEGVSQVRELMTAMNSPSLSNYHFRIEGYTDTVGSVAYNLRLSTLRAASVVSFLVNQGKIQPDRLESHGYGKSNLAVQTPDNTPDPRNRRVHIVTVSK